MAAFGDAFKITNGTFSGLKLYSDYWTSSQKEGDSSHPWSMRCSGNEFRTDYGTGMYHVRLSKSF